MSSMRRIVKAKLHPDYKLDVEYLEIHGGDDETAPDPVSRKGQHQAHGDLVECFNSIRIHMATLCEQGHFTEFEEQPDKLEIFPVSGISIGGEDEHEGVTIVGQRTLKGNKVLNLVAPFTKLSPDHSDYQYVSSLDLVVKELLIQVDEYLNGKYAPSNQLNLFDKPLIEEEFVDGNDNAIEKPKKEKKAGKSRKLKVDISQETEELEKVS